MEVTTSGPGIARLRAATPPQVAALLRTATPAVAIFVLQILVFPVPPGVFVRGLIVGGLGALIALGMALIYRANRIINFAQSELGAVPAGLAVFLILFSGLNYFLAATVGVLSALLLGAVVEMAIIRRFFGAPRLILTVATIGLATLLAVFAIVLPLVWDRRPGTFRLEPPFEFRFEIDPIIFSANDLIAVIVAPLAVAAVIAFLRFTSVGVAVRASAESADRASLLGVPVKRLQTVVWAVAALLSFIALFLRAGIVGLPFISGFTFGLLLSAMAALVLGRASNFTTIVTSALALGALEGAIAFNVGDDLSLSPLLGYVAVGAVLLGYFGGISRPVAAGGGIVAGALFVGNVSVWQATFALESAFLITAVLGVVIVVALLVLQPGGSRAEQDQSSTWQAAEDVRPIPAELRSLPEVRITRLALGVSILGGAVVLPHLLGPGNVLKASAVLIFAIIGVSIVVLTGWAGQVSLGQMGFAAVGAATAAYATSRWGLDLTLAVLFAGTIGAVTALLVGLPALRLRGFFLGVTTLAFSAAVSSYFLNEQFFAWVPTGRIERLPLFGRISIESPTAMYYVSLVGLVLVAVGVAGIRRSRTGRVLIALRENEVATQAYGISVTRAKLTAFAISGFIASFGGALFVHHQQAFSPVLYLPNQSLIVFTSTVIGGLGSVTGAVLGAIYLRGAQWFLPGPRWQLFANAAGVLFVLMVIPFGLGGLYYRTRDRALRWVAERRNLIVPSLMADRAEEPFVGEVDAERAEKIGVEEATAVVGGGP